MTSSERPPLLQGLCPTALKSVCRKLGLSCWPYRQNRYSGKMSRSASCDPVASVVVEDNGPARASSCPSKARGREGRDAYAESLLALLAADGHWAFTAAVFEPEVVEDTHASDLSWLLPPRARVCAFRV